MKSGEIQWNQAIPGEKISSNEVHVWRESLDVGPDQNKRLLGILSPDELERAGRLRFERDQKYFIAARGILRIILGHYLGEDPHKIRFEYTSNGKPVLAITPDYDKLCFNLSHSCGLALYALTRDRNIGIDIEHVRDDVAYREIARKFFSRGEINSLESFQKEKRNEVFFRYWTRKEALLKAIGEGISSPMKHFDVSIMNGDALSPIIFPGEKIEHPRWYVRDLFPYRGYAAAIAGERGDWDLHFCINKRW
jgi:4'-phosphopantetheinyl transferase